MTVQAEFPLIVTGAGGRVGRLLRKAMPGDGVMWVTRNPQQAGDVAWEAMLGGVADDTVILHFAGAVRGELGLNTLLARQVCGLAGVGRVFVASSVAVYGPAGEDLQESTPAKPQNAYGQAKLAMEQAVQGDRVTLLRIGNVAGADALLGGLQPGVQTVLDPVAGQRGPVRSYIGPVTLAQTLWQLAKMAHDSVALPQVLNVAQPGAVAMGDLLDAAGTDWVFGPENPAVVPKAVLDVQRLCTLMPMAAVSAKSLVDEWRQVQ